MLSLPAFYFITILFFILLLIYGAAQGVHPGGHSNPAYSLHPPPQSHHTPPIGPNVVVISGAAVVVVGAAVVVVVVSTLHAPPLVKSPPDTDIL